jgi:hypothetical protein
MGSVPMPLLAIRGGGNTHDPLAELNPVLFVWFVVKILKFS